MRSGGQTRPVRLLAALVFVVWLAGGTVAGELPAPRAPSAAPPRLLTPAPDAVQLRRLPPVERPIQAVGFEDSGHLVSRAARRAVAQLPESVRGDPADDPNCFAIDLATALRLADAENWQIAIAREQVNLALARVDAANALWLPSLRGGVNYNRHDGAIQDVRGFQFNTTRSALYAGAGAGIYGAGTPLFPGIYTNFHLADALFQPLAARQFAGARGRAAAAATNDTLLQVTLAYLELLRAGEEVAIARSVLDDAQQLADITRAYAETGEGLISDANRARTELAARENDVARARETQSVVSARLAQLLRLDPTVLLAPAEPAVVPVEPVSPDTPVKELITQGLSRRPELAECQLLVGEAVARMRRERLAPLIPSILMGASYGGMGAGVNTDMASFKDRFDLDAVAYWEMRNFGFGDAAARRGACSALRSSQLRQMSMMDQVAREVTEAHVQVQSRKGQMSVATRGVAAAGESYRQNADRIEQAKGLPIEVLQSIQALAQARRELLRTVIDYNSAQFTLYRAVGWPAKLPEALTAPAGR